MEQYKKLYNCTAHNQEAYIEAFKKFGFDIEEEPRVRRVGKNPSTGKVEVEDLEKEAVRVAAEIPANSCCLVGGAGPLVERLSIELLRKRCRLYSATSERITNEAGNFVFNLSGVDETPLSRLYRKGVFAI